MLGRRFSSVACVVRWAASAHVREREGRWPARLRAEKRRKGGPARLERGRGERVGRFCFFFKPIFKPISNLYKFKSFTSFQIQILTQISPTILKAFHKPFLTTFHTYFKFKPLHKFSQTISQLCLRIFTSILRLLKPHHSQNSCIQIMMHKHLLLLNY
jgi:hypothetical protein